MKHIANSGRLPQVAERAKAGVTSGGENLSHPSITLGGMKRISDSGRLPQVAERVGVGVAMGGEDLSHPPVTWGGMKHIANSGRLPQAAERVDAGVATSGGNLSQPPVTLESMKRVANSERVRAADEQIGAGLGILGEEAAGAGSRAELEEVAGAVKRAKARLAGLETAIALRLSREEGKREAAEIMQDQMGMTSHQAKYITKVSEGLAEMPNTRAKLAAGEITLEHASALTGAARECGARRVDQDAGLLGEAVASNPDGFRKKAREWTSANSRDREEESLRRQRGRRKAYMFWDPAKDMGVLHAELDRIAFGQVRQALDLGVDRLRRDDSGRGVSPDEFRSNEQRRADALFELLTGRDSETFQPLSEAGAQTGKPSTQLVVVADIGVLDGSRPGGRCEVLGSGPVPPSVLGRLSPDTSLSGIIFGGKGRVLWLGRKQRLGNAAQRMAAAVRDGGCVRCDISTHQTQLHHIWDWYDGGPTDIDNLASLCGSHHRQLQDDNLELFQQDGRWKTRPRPGPPVRAGPG